MTTISFSGGRIFNGHDLLDNHCVIFTKGLCTAVVPHRDLPKVDREFDLCGDLLSPGYADLQVNGGGGVLLNDNPSVEILQQIAGAHQALGTTTLLPTLITSTEQRTQAAIDATIKTIELGTTGIAGLHLEGPHLSIEKKGAHDANLIRPMQPQDLQQLVQAAEKLPLLKITIAPENVSLEQVKALTRAGVLIALGHTNATYETCMNYYHAGARCVTHLFNAMSQLGSRDPGLVGMAMDNSNTKTGLIADGIHVHPASIRATINSMGGLHRVYLVSDAMAVAGTTLNSFELDGRIIHRKDGRLTLSDGTLAGADLELTRALHFLVNEVGAELKDALCSAVTVPRSLLAGTNTPFALQGQPMDSFIKITAALTGVDTLSRLASEHKH